MRGADLTVDPVSAPAFVSGVRPAKVAGSTSSAQALCLRRKGCASMTHGRVAGSGVSAGRGMNRREFLKLGGAGLAGAALLGSAACGGGSSGSGDLIFSMGTDTSGTLPSLVDKFNKQSKDFKVQYREMPTDTGAYFDKLRTQFQAGGGDIDVIGADVVWPVQFAANGWLLDVTDRFPKSDARAVPARAHPIPQYDGRSSGFRGSRTRDSSTTGLISWRRPASRSPRRPGTSSRRWAPRSPRTRASTTASSSRETSTRAGCATAASTSGPTAATSSTLPTPRRWS